MRPDRPGAKDGAGEGRPPGPAARAGANARGSAPSAIPSEAVRGAVTLAVSIFLIGVALSVAANSGSGSSALVGTVHDRLFSPWLVPAWLDLGFDYRLTYGLPDDADHFIEVAPWGAGTAPRRLPAPGVTGERAARWRRLARAIAEGEADPEREGLLPEGLAAGLFRLAGADDVELRVVRTLPPERTAAGTAARRDEVVVLRLRRVGGAVQLIRDTPLEELAPLVPAARAGEPH